MIDYSKTTIGYLGLQTGADLCVIRGSHFLWILKNNIFRLNFY
jgi:hypothetical protein